MDARKLGGVKAGRREGLEAWMPGCWEAEGKRLKVKGKRLKVKGERIKDEGKR